ncbi:protein OSB2, chloroplastic-like protein [Cinnamomum micranthum f. kanehirae]|uniref:Protein OSB2, chloroplastic-like protein n=1 Tax=Cinnamomum micranthum f. kanehirae TaxID=337451 RepID=A0A3S3MWP5_9MAGN|nr:protein OSB2, chloroplastic-like protein [Cinnamomum micranthum f. kanehirae]
MALHALLLTPTKSSLGLSFSTCSNPKNPFTTSKTPPHSLFSSSFSDDKNHQKKKQQLGFLLLRCSNNSSSNSNSSSSSLDFQHDRVVYPRPAEVPWKKELANSVNLIGVVGTPIQIKHLSSGKVLAWTRLAVKRSATETVWINLTFWDELAHVAFQHVEKGHQIYVSGRLVSDTVEGDDEKRQTYYKVVVQQLNFVEKTFPKVSLYEPERDSMTAGEKVGNFSGNHLGSTEELWQAFFANPVDWWDNRNNKRNPKYPDFKHKDTKEALWIESKYNPPWVKSQLAILDARMQSLNDNGTGMPVTFMSGDDFTPF